MAAAAPSLALLLAHPGIVERQWYKINGEEAADSTGWGLFRRSEWTCCGDPDTTSTHCLLATTPEQRRPDGDEIAKLIALMGETYVAASRCKKGHGPMDFKTVKGWISPNCDLCWGDITRVHVHCSACSYHVCKECFDRGKRGEGPTQLKQRDCQCALQ